MRGPRKPNPNPIEDPDEKVAISRQELRQLQKDSVLLKAVKDAGILDDPNLSTAIYAIAKGEYNWHQL